MASVWKCFAGLLQHCCIPTNQPVPTWLYTEVVEYMTHYFSCREVRLSQNVLADAAQYLRWPWRGPTTDLNLWMDGMQACPKEPG